MNVKDNFKENGIKRKERVNAKDNIFRYRKLRFQMTFHFYRKLKGEQKGFRHENVIVK